MKTKEDQKKKAERFRLNYDKGYICAQSFKRYGVEVRFIHARVPEKMYMLWPLIYRA